MMWEIEARADVEDQVQSIYLGGGTPSLLTTAELKQLFDHIHHHFDVNGSAEITLEANPDDLDPTKLREWKAIGINRLSIGIQSFIESDLIWMNRAHTAEEAENALSLARSAGFEHFSIDLIYGLPTWKDNEWNYNLEQLKQLGVDHFSCYILTVEERTVLGSKVASGKENVAPESAVEEQYKTLCEFASRNGYKHYEVSNFAHPNHLASHNSAYWEREKYIGIGPGAHSFDGQSRRWNISNNPVYIKHIQQGKSFFEEEQLSEKDQYNEYIMTGLRTAKGINPSFAKSTFGFSPTDEPAWNDLVQSGMLVQEGDAFVIPEKSWLLTDRVASELFRL